MIEKVKNFLNPIPLSTPIFLKEKSKVAILTSSIAIAILGICLVNKLLNKLTSSNKYVPWTIFDSKKFNVFNYLLKDKEDKVEVKNNYGPDPSTFYCDLNDLSSPFTIIHLHHSMSLLIIKIERVSSVIKEKNAIVIFQSHHTLDACELFNRTINDGSTELDLPCFFAYKYNPESEEATALNITDRGICDQIYQKDHLRNLRKLIKGHTVTLKEQMVENFENSEWKLCEN